MTIEKTSVALRVLTAINNKHKPEEPDVALSEPTVLIMATWTLTKWRAS